MNQSIYYALNILYFLLWCLFHCNLPRKQWNSSFHWKLGFLSVKQKPRLLHSRGSLGRQRTAEWTSWISLLGSLPPSCLEERKQFVYTQVCSPFYQTCFLLGRVQAFSNCVPNSRFRSHQQQVFWGTLVWAQQCCLLVLGQPPTNSSGQPMHEYLTWQSATLPILRGSLGLLVQGTGQKEGLVIITKHSAFVGTFWGCWLIGK